MSEHVEKVKEFQKLMMDSVQLIACIDFSKLSEEDEDKVIQKILEITAITKASKGK